MDKIECHKFFELSMEFTRYFQLFVQLESFQTRKTGSVHSDTVYFPIFRENYPTSRNQIRCWLSLVLSFAKKKIKNLTAMCIEFVLNGRTNEPWKRRGNLNSPPPRDERIIEIAQTRRSVFQLRKRCEFRYFVRGFRKRVRELLIYEQEILSYVKLVPFVSPGGDFDVSIVS